MGCERTRRSGGQCETRVAERQIKVLKLQRLRLSSRAAPTQHTMKRAMTDGCKKCDFTLLNTRQCGQQCVNTVRRTLNNTLMSRTSKSPVFEKMRRLGVFYWGGSTTNKMSLPANADALLARHFAAAVAATRCMETDSTVQPTPHQKFQCYGSF